LAEAGAEVAVCDVDAEAIGQAAKDPRIALAHVADVSSPKAVHQFFDKVRDAFGGVELLVNNAGIAGPTVHAEDISDADWSETLGVNLTGQFLCAREVIGGMKEARRGLILNISSSSARTGLPLRLPYAVSKAAVLSLTTNLARELGPYGIRVNAILPGAITGERLEKVIAAKSAALSMTPDDYAKSLFRFISLRCPVKPEDIAAMVLFLASPQGEKVSGQLIGVDGNVEWEE
jgi:NAD(P)-dependent dehydrogenase (short-subunit alcohol dehydrogenase family)